METLLQSERQRRTCILRPAVFSVLMHLKKAMEASQIHGAFVFSNNGNDEVVAFLARFLNYCTRSLYKAEFDVFQMACSANTAARNPYGMVKHFQAIQTCLLAHGLPKCGNESDLLFFDDLDHPLRAEIKHYVQVPAYLCQTSIPRFLEAMQPMKQCFPDNVWNVICQQTLDLHEEFCETPHSQPRSTIVQDRTLFRNAITNFLRSMKRTRKARVHSYKRVV